MQRRYIHKYKKSKHFYLIRSNKNAEMAFYWKQQKVAVNQDNNNNNNKTGISWQKRKINSSNRWDNGTHT